MALWVLILYKPVRMKTKKRQPAKWLVYLLRCSDDTFYTGATNQLENRLISHNRGTASKYTRSRRPVVLLVKSVCLEKGEALRLEAKIKKLPRAKKIAAFSPGPDKIPGDKDTHQFENMIKDKTV